MFQIVPERAGDGPAIEALLDRAFGPGREAKTVYRLRQRRPPADGLSFVAVDAAGLQGSIRFWPVEIGGAAGRPALLLGPVAVAPERQGQGIGRALVRRGLEAAAARGHGAAILVGDAAYYSQFGFVRALAAGLELPGPVDPERFLGLELKPGALAGAAGPVARPRRWVRRLAA